MRKEYTFHSREEKLAIVKRYLSGESSKALDKLVKKCGEVLEIYTF